MIRYSVIGHLVLDIKVRQGVTSYALGGTATYGAFAAKIFGANVRIFSKVGVDFPEDYILLLARYGIDVTHVKRVSKKSTSFKLVYKNGDRELFLEALCEPLLPQDVEEALSSDVIHVGSVYWEVPLDTLKYLRTSNALIALDLQGYIRKVDDQRRVTFYAPSDVWDYLKYADLIHAEVKEAKVVVGEGEPLEITRSLHRKTGKIVTITLGEKGSFVAYEGSVYYVPAAKPERVADPTGAGDVYTAIFAIVFAEERDVLKAAAYASAASSFLVEEPGPKGVAPRSKVEVRAREIYSKIREIK